MEQKKRKNNDIISYFIKKNRDSENATQNDKMLSKDDTETNHLLVPSTSSQVKYIDHDT